MDNERTYQGRPGQTSENSQSSPPTWAPLSVSQSAVEPQYAFSPAGVQTFGYQAGSGTYPSAWNPPNQRFAALQSQHSLPAGITEPPNPTQHMQSFASPSLNQHAFGMYSTLPVSSPQSPAFQSSTPPASQIMDPPPFQYPPQAYHYQYQPPPLLDVQNLSAPLQAPLLPSPMARPATSQGLAFSPFPGPNWNSTTPSVVFQELEHRLTPILQEIRGGDLRLVVGPLIALSQWLLSNAQAFHLHEDNEAQDSTRLQLWRDFNNTWLACMQRQMDLTTEQLAGTGTNLTSPRRLTSQCLDNMHRVLSRLCDPLDDLGLVDWERGVWEGQIGEIIRHCIEMARPIDDFRPSSSTTSPTYPQSHTSYDGHYGNYSSPPQRDFPS